MATEYDRKIPVLTGLLILLPLFSLFAQQRNYSLKNLVDSAQHYYPQLFEKQALLNGAQAAVTDARHLFLPSLKVNEQIGLGTDNSIPGSYNSFSIIPSASSGVRKNNTAESATGNIAILSGQYDLVDFGYRHALIENTRSFVNLYQADHDQEAYKIKIEAARLYFNLDKEHYQRLLEAANTAGAISPLDLSTIKTKMEADSALSNAEKSNWQMQETMQTYLKVTAPFDGVITDRNVHPGALISAASKDKPMLELKQIAHLRLQVDIPESIAVNLKNKDSISFYTSVMPGKKMTGFISRESGNVNTQFRSERMEIDVMNKDGRLSPGMYADVLIYSKGNSSALSVPKSAVITNTERKYIVLVRDQKTVKVDVTTGNEAIGKIEIFGNVKAGDQVIVHPGDEIKDGDLVSE